MRRFLRLLQLAKNYRMLIALSILCNLLTALFTVVSAPAIIPFLQILFGVDQIPDKNPDFVLSLDGIKNFVNYHLSNLIEQQGQEHALIYICTGIVLIFFLKNLFRYLAAFFMAPVRNGMVKDIRQQLFDKVIRLDLSWFTERRKGDLMARISTDVQEIEWSIFNVLVTVFREPLVILGSLIFLLYVSFQLTLFVILLMLFTGIIIGGIGKALKKQSSLVQQHMGDLLARLEESLSGLRLVKSFNAEKYQSQKFLQENNNYSQLLTRLLWRRDLSSPLSEFLGVTMVAILLWYGSALVFTNQLAAETFLAYIFAFFNVSQPTKSFSNAFYNIQKGLAAVDRIDDILDVSPSINPPENKVNISSLKEAIEFKNVNFSYAGAERKTLENINLKVPKGKVIAVVGSSGSGKTTLIDLLLRFYDVENGAIFIDKIDIKKLSLNNLRRLFGVVSQEPVLFHDSIFNNISFGLENISQDQVEKAAKIANAHEFIINTENGYKTNIGDRGNKLSGGQKQRLTIARAILRNPPVLILDEATSALDATAEKLVREALENIMSERTTIIIAHRLSTIQYADEIVVLKEGRIVEKGTHKDLLHKKGEYQKFIKLQMVKGEN